MKPILNIHLIILIFSLIIIILVVINLIYLKVIQNIIYLFGYLFNFISDYSFISKIFILLKYDIKKIAN